MKLSSLGSELITCTFSVIHLQRDLMKVSLHLSKKVTKMLSIKLVTLQNILQASLSDIVSWNTKIVC